MPNRRQRGPLHVLSGGDSLAADLIRQAIIKESQGPLFKHLERNLAAEKDVLSEIGNISSQTIDSPFERDLTS